MISGTNPHQIGVYIPYPSNWSVSYGILVMIWTLEGPWEAYQIFGEKLEWKFAYFAVPTEHDILLASIGTGSLLYSGI